MPRRPREEMRRAREAEGVMAASLKSNEVVPASNTRSAVMGRATIEAVLEMSAEGVAGPKQAGRSRAKDGTVKTTRCGTAGRVVWSTCRIGRCVWSGHGSGGGAQVREARSRCRRTRRCGGQAP